MTTRINVITPFYKDSDFYRQLELREALHRNVRNPEVGRIFVLVEEGAEDETLLRNSKVTAIPVSKGRQTYADLIRVANEYCAGEIVVFCNTDIHFDETISYVRNLPDRASLFVSTRREVQPEDKSEWTINQQSSDAWAMYAPISAYELDIQLGKLGCESLFLGRMIRSGFAVDNVSLDWKCYHLHATQKRNYNPMVDRYAEDSEMAFPVLSGRSPDRKSVRPTDGPIVIDGVAFSSSSSTVLWRDILTEWHKSEHRDDFILLNRGGLERDEIGMTQSEAPPFNSFLLTSAREINGTIGRRLGASVFVSTGLTTALGVPSVVVATTATPEVLAGNLELRVFQGGLSFELADLVLCAGDDIRLALEERYQHIGRSRFVHCPLWYGADSIFGCMPAPERAFARARLGHRERYVVMAGERVHGERTKNLRVVAEALRQLGDLGVVFIGERYQHIGRSRFVHCPLWYGADSIFGCMPAPERAFARARLGHRERYVVMAGERVHGERTKNLRVVAEALRQLGDLGVVFIGGAGAIEPEVRALFEGIQLHHLAEDSERTLLTLAAAEAFLLPELAGNETDWAHLALSTGCPIARARWSPLHRDGKGTLFFGSASVEQLSDLMRGLLRNGRDPIGSIAAERARAECSISNARRIIAFVMALRSGSRMPTEEELLAASRDVPLQGVTHPRRPSVDGGSVPSD